ncbi:Putative BCNT-C domain-containing protein [Septoria linicola]|uniref:SWR1-complex protein 5 n=1 Tax=Septoria linicola TaxID=215465 RepID=A0A9Q9APK1_9PEZI|nr:putative BCNT-C domain-containing protein [Septoria linicola]USW49873.1 Putative BCNT-C domain-containing protein [Septoria linicola]
MDEDMEDIDRKEEESAGEEYDENADEDFNPEQAKDGPDNSESSSDEDEDDAQSSKTAKKSKATKGKRKVTDATHEADLDSGDEATIRERKTKRRKKNTTTHDEDSGGEGGFIRTRRQRAVEKEERKNRKRGVREGAVTIDVDKLWAELSSVPIGRTALPPLLPTNGGGDDMDVDEDDKENDIGGEMVTIKRRSQYAGEITYIEVEVPRNSKEARRYFEEHPELDPHRAANTEVTNTSASTTHRPLRRPSMFEPNPTGLVKGVAPEKLRLRAPSRIDVLMAQKRAEAKKSAQKLSTMQMSQYDWKSYVEKEGLKDELDTYERSGNRFLAKEAFLDRAAGAREAAARDARLKI